MMTLDDCRSFYAEEVRWAANLNSAALVEPYARVPREKYLGPPPWQIGSPELRALSVSGCGGMTYRSLLKLKSVRLDAHAPGETCVVHASGMCLSSAEPAATPPAPAT